MASGCWLIAAKCHSQHNSLNTDEVVRAWILLPTHKEKVSLPEVTNAVYYRKEIALGLRLSKARWRRKGWSCLTAKTTDSTANSTEARRRLFTTSEKLLSPARNSCQSQKRLRDRPPTIPISSRDGVEDSDRRLGNRVRGATLRDNSAGGLWGGNVWLPLCVSHDDGSSCPFANFNNQFTSMTSEVLRL